jgi:hypothetical protein
LNGEWPTLEKEKYKELEIQEEKERKAQEFILWKAKQKEKKEEKKKKKQTNEKNEEVEQKEKSPHDLPKQVLYPSALSYLNFFPENSSKTPSSKRLLPILINKPLDFHFVDKFISKASSPNYKTFFDLSKKESM